MQLGAVGCAGQSRVLCGEKWLGSLNTPSHVRAATGDAAARRSPLPPRIASPPVDPLAFHPPSSSAPPPLCSCGRFARFRCPARPLRRFERAPARPSPTSTPDLLPNGDPAARIIASHRNDGSPLAADALAPLPPCPSAQQFAWRSARGRWRRMLL